jgi:CheY-like chemotaxis protein
MPDTIFAAVINPQTNQFHVQVSLPTSDFICEDAHAGIITDISMKVMNGQKIVFTASQDQKIRAYMISPDNTSLQKQAE